MRELFYQVSGHPMRFFLGRHCLNHFADIIAPLDADRLFLLADRQVFSRFGESLLATLNRIAPATLLPLVDGEPDKRLATLEKLAIAANDAGITRRSVVISLGGGATGNIAGLFSALMLRGLRFVDIPTSFLAMHDSSTSLKQAVNLPGAKNQLGVYKSPEAVLIDTAFLDALPDSHLWAGMVELVKNALVLDDDYRTHFDAILNRPGGWRDKTEDLIASGIDAKLKRLEIDPHERKEALVFEYGHTLGHAIEAAYYPQIHHGLAIYIGMRAAARIAVQMGLMSSAAHDHHRQRLSILHGPLADHPPLDIPRVLRHVPRDNKRGYRTGKPGHIDFVLISDVGKPLLDDAGRPLTSVPENMLAQSLENPSERRD